MSVGLCKLLIAKTEIRKVSQPVNKLCLVLQHHIKSHIWYTHYLNLFVHDCFYSKFKRKPYKASTVHIIISAVDYICKNIQLSN